MKYRFAKLADLNDIVNLHYGVREYYPIGFFSEMNKCFLHQYYKILLQDKNEIILCAEDDSKQVQGFISATLDVKEQFNHLKRHKISLGFSALGTFIMKPKMIFEVLKRFKSMTSSNNEGKKFIYNEGVRGEFWVWNNKDPNPIAAVELQSRLMQVLKALGVKRMYSEVDSINKKVVKFHKLNKAIEVERILLPDGRERILLYNDLDNSAYSK